jgi:hypothetical protein
MNQADFEGLLNDTTKRVVGDVTWAIDEDRSPAVEFRMEVQSDVGYPIFVKGSYNALASTLTYTLVHRGSGRIYALDLGKDHHNPTCTNTGEKHKHRWREPMRDKEAYVPDDITSPATDPVSVWRQFCAEAKINHDGVMHPPPPVQMELL